MINEHAITYKDKLSIGDLHYLITKANLYGKNGKEVIRVYQEEDIDGFHVYFEVKSLREYAHE